MKKQIFKKIISLLLVLAMVLPSTMTAFAQDSGKVVYEYEKATVVNPVANTWYEATGATGDGPAAWAFDGKTATWWHTNWGTETNENPLSGSMTWGTVANVPAFADVAESRAWIGGEFEEPTSIGKFTYTGRTDKTTNWFGQYAIYTANVTGREVTESDFALAYTATNSGHSKIELTFDTPQTITHFRVVAFTATSTNFVTAAEIEVFKAIVADTTPGFAGSIVDVDTQYTQNRFDEVKRMSKTSETLSAWKNDKAISEIALVAKYAAFDNVTVTASDFTDGKGNTISSNNVTTTFIKSTKAYNGGYLGYGDPNRAYPEDNGSNRSESSDILYQTTLVDMAENSVQPVWVEIAVPEDAAAGTYTGTITVAADGADSLEFTYAVNVYDAVLPDAVEFKNGFDIELWQYPYSSAEYYGVEPFSPEHLKAMESSMEIYKEIGGHAITTSIVEEAWSGQTYSKNAVHYPSMVKWTKNSDGSFSYDYTDFDAWVTFCKSMGIGDKIVLYSIAPWNGSIGYWQGDKLTYQGFNLGNTNDQKIWKTFIADLINHLMEKGWFDDAYMGIDERGFSAAAFDLIASVKNKDGVALKTAGAMDNFVNKWDLALRVTDLNVGDTAAAHNAAKFEELLEAREALGYRTTLYSCTEHKPGQFSLSAPVESYWTVLNAGKMGTAGFLRWAYDAWVEDPLNDATHNAFEAGDCFLIYPDVKGTTTPVSKSSVRLERLAQGVRDVNKLMLIAEEVPALNDQIEAAYGNIQYALQTSRSYMSADEVAVLRAETGAFKAALDEITEVYVAYKAGGVEEIESLTLAEGSKATLSVGDTLELTPVFTPENVVNTNVIWSSTNTSVVSVKDGVVKALQEGSATVTATAKADETKKAEITITVTGVVIDDAKKVSYYSFDNVTGTALVDEWGERDGVIAGGTAKGKSGDALEVTEAGVGATIDGSLNTLTQDWTVSYWVKTTADLTKEISVVEDAEMKYSASMKMASDRDAGFRVGNNSGDVLTYAYDFAKGTWYHITWVQDKDQGLAMYVNGNLVKSNNWTVNNTIKAPIDVIGGTGFTGLIDEVKVFNAVLTQAEITSLMKVSGINIPSEVMEVGIGEQVNINATLISDSADKTITYVSADEKVATVSDDGVITGTGIGRTTITLTAAGGYTATITVKTTKEISIINELTIYDLPERYQSNVEGAAHDEEGTLVGTNRQYLGQPDMVQTDSGKLITVFPTGHGHGPLIMKYSLDEGETWIEHENMPESWKDSQETPTIYSLRMEDGSERLVLICACPGTWGNYSTGWDFSYSDDDGKTWTEFEHFWSTFTNGNKNDVIVGMASLVQLKDADGNEIQKWMGVYHNGAYVNYKTYLTFDEEGNPQWTEPVPYLSEYRSIESSHQICEVGMFRSPDGERIVALGRNQTHKGPATMFYSDDEGETWSEPVELPGSLAGERHKVKYDPITGRLVITFREIDYDRDNDGVWEGGSDWTAGDWVAWVGTYEDLMQLNQGEYMIRLDEDFSANYNSGDTGYTGMVVLEDGTFVLHSYGHWDKEFSESYKGTSGGGYDVRTDLCWIRQAKFKLADVENEYGITEGSLNRGDLSKAIANAEKISKGDYTDESWDAFQAALEAAQEVYTDTEATQEEIDKAANDLTAAQQALTLDPGKDPTNDSMDIPTDQYTATAGSTQSGNSPDRAIDGNENNYWEVAWGEGGRNFNNLWYQIELDEAEEIDGLRYLPRYGSNLNAGEANGFITGYRVEVSMNGTDWETAAEGTWELEGGWKLAQFDEAVTAKFVRLVATSTYAANGNNLEMSICELRVKAAEESDDKEADKADLAAAIEAAEKVEEDAYTAETWEAFAEALEAAKAVNEDAAATQEAVDKALADLTAAQEALEEKPAPVVNPFEDVKEADYYYAPVLWAVEKGITTGTSATTFSPEDTCTRGAVVTFLWRAAGCPEPEAKETAFVDITEADYYYKAVLWAVEEGITTGTSATTFAPNEGCTRGQVVTFLFRASGEKAPEAATNAFTDVVKGAYYEKAVLWAVEKGITTGTSATTFEPDSNCTRGQIVTFIYRSEK